MLEIRPSRRCLRRSGMLRQPRQRHRNRRWRTFGKVRGEGEPFRPDCNPDALRAVVPAQDRQRSECLALSIRQHLASPLALVC